MKYAILGPRKRINRIMDTAPQNDLDRIVVEMTDEQAAIVEAGKNVIPQINYFFIDGKLLTIQEYFMLDQFNQNPQLAKENKLKEIANDRYNDETGGIEFNGNMISTSRSDQAMINGAWSYLQANPTETIQFKSASGWISLDLNTISTIGTAIGQHVQSRFAREAELAAQVEAATTFEELNSIKY